MANLSIDDWKDLSIAHVIIIKSEVATFIFLDIYGGIVGVAIEM